MSGKVYTMKEMKNIVTYLTEHKAYGEIRGRKMWVDFANSNSTTRTWQSLKETFLKRILPDIHNPYYNLTREQIISFRQGYVVDERDKNKLQIEVVAEIHKNNDQHVISSDDEAMVQGENDKCSNIISKDISEKNNCYETVDDIRRDLESPKVDEDKKQKDLNLEKKPPALVNVLKDFASDSEDCLNNIEDISAVQIEEKTDSVPLQHNDTGKKETDSVDDVQHVETDTVEVKSEKDNSMEEPSQPNNTDNDTDKQISEKVVPTESGNKKVIEKDTSNDILEISSPNNKNTESDKKNENSETVTTPTKSSCQPLTNSTSDTILPNNQEGLKDQTQNNTKTDDLVESKKISSNHTRKRSSSAETVLLENKRHKRNSTSNISKKNCNPEENASDLEIFDVHGSDSAKERATSTQIDKAKNTSANAIKSDDEEPQTQNPCLKSVSLFAEQFNKIKYSDTTSDENAVEEIDPKPSGSKDPKKNQKEIVKDDVVVLKSHSESESDEEPQEKRPAVSKRVTRAQRDKALANVFGFTSGAVSSNRNRKSNQNRVRRPHNVHHINNVTDSESSEWTTDTEQDNFISPPRCRQNRKTRKYMKPKSTRILSLEEEGGLFVMYGKRIYPVVKDGRIVKNYLIYESNSDSGFEQDSYWKAKYAELKKKYEDNKKTKEPSERLREKRQGSATREPSSPILQSNIRKNPTTAQNRDIHAPSTSNTKPTIESKEVLNYPVENKMSTDKIMIKYTINNAEVQLEGHWPQICPIFDKVLDILPRKTDPQMEVANNKLEVHEPSKVISSGESTPVIVTADYVQEKIDKLESEIFKEIEEKDKQEKIEKTEDEQMERNEDELMEQNKKENPNNVTTRKRGRPMQTRPKQSMPPESPKSSKKQLRTNKVEQELSTPIAKPTLEIVEKQSNAGPVESSPQVVKRRTRRSMKVAQDAHNVEELKTNKVTPKQSNVTEETQEDDVRYMFPSTTPQTNTNRQKPKRY